MMKSHSDTLFGGSLALFTIDPSITNKNTIRTKGALLASNNSVVYQNILKSCNASKATAPTNYDTSRYISKVEFKKERYGMKDLNDGVILSPQSIICHGKGEA